MHDLNVLKTFGHDGKEMRITRKPSVRRCACLYKDHSFDAYQTKHISSWLATCIAH